MIQRKLIQILLMPFSLMYGLGVSLRNIAYRYGLLKGVTFNLPVISVGNLTIGGAGKTPHIEYLIRTLKDYIEVATLSRGYGRKTRGFLMVGPGHKATEVGDEPLQFKRKFPEVMVAVGENRTFAVPQMVTQRPDLQLILLDDAFQHRAVKPGYNILLTEYNRPYTRDYLLPAGRLREWRAAAQRADIIVVTKCPPVLPASDRAAIIKEIAPLSYQKVFFSYYSYQYPYYLFNPNYRIQLTDDLQVLLVSAIARTDYLVDYLTGEVELVKNMEYEDHHTFTKYDVGQIKRNFDLMPTEKKIILTTEKDAMRLEEHREYLVTHQVPVFVLPIQVAFHNEDGEKFDAAVKQFLLEFKV